MSLYLTDLYYAQRSYPLDEVQTDILVYLYQPLITSQGFSLYMFLYNEAKRMDRFHKSCALSRITHFLNLDVDKLDSLLRMLEAIGLLKTYYRRSKSQVTYVYSLQSPLSIKAFFKNHILTTLLTQTIGKEELEKTKVFFRVASENLKDYEAMNIRFQDVFDVDLSQVRPLRLRDHYVEVQSMPLEIDYDLDLFYEALRNNQVPLKIVKNRIDEIKQIAVIYHIDPLTLSSLTREALHDQEIDITLLKDKAKAYYSMDSLSTLSEVYHTQPDRYKSPGGAQSKLDQHLAYLESISPYELLKNAQGGREPVVRDLTIAETLMVQLGLTPGVTNVLLEYVMGQNAGRLPRAYIETIGASWARRGLKTAKEAYDAAMQADEGEEVKPVETTVETPAEEVDLMGLLNRVKGEQYD